SSPEERLLPRLMKCDIPLRMPARRPPSDLPGDLELPLTSGEPWWYWTGGRPALLFTTHHHFDHWQALTEVAAALKVPTAAGRLDAAELPVTPDRLVDDGDRIVVGDLTLDAIHLVGHTPGSIALALTDGDRGERSDGGGDTVHLFTGDCLFPGGVGKTWKDGDFEILLEDVSEKLFGRYGDNTVIYPGHGKDTTLGAERPHLDEWRERGW
ncbi:MAG TPA: MBL fold metallo-hydrolase, partial [Gordonia sp. (in: high G+C Gram-positive bacteria)]|nr:MBL fold metallo-hydrolase [Gordonia sp. (in: high G+C Gram-positive bacteria)]